MNAPVSVLEFYLSLISYNILMLLCGISFNTKIRSVERGICLDARKVLV